MTERTSDIGKASGFCLHGNEPATCELCGAERQALHGLLLTPEEEDAEAQRRGPPPYLQVERDGDRMIAIFGTQHVYTAEQVQPAVDALQETAPDVLFVEGEQWERVDPTIPDDEVLKKYGEQAYLARLAQKKGIEVRTWDVPHAERIAAAVREHGPDATAGWMVGQAAKHLIAQGRPRTPEAIRDMAGAILDGRTREALDKEGLALDLSDQNIEALSERFVGKPLAEWDADDAEALATPRRRGPTNDVIRVMNELRDTHALDVMHDAKFAAKKVFVLAGGSHALTWEKAVKKLYSSES